MEQYTGYPFQDDQRSKRQATIPRVKIGDTIFEVNLEARHFQQAGDPANKLLLPQVEEERGFSHIFYDTTTKNHYAGNTRDVLNVPEHVVLVIIPPWKELDPVGLARKQGLPDHYHKRVSGEDILELKIFSQEPKKELIRSIRQRLKT